LHDRGIFTTLPAVVT